MGMRSIGTAMLKLIIAGLAGVDATALLVV
jgi:hypothetical protein